ncbi:putative RNA triphosphatase [Leptomonas seymouri]|uniref:mRNA 5'-phosphatase n=1 Tax=Leptomonas seymouri TaxID=5684 RepID=A0A0N0P8I3_LEPSE|nr:putative RNA triphosphatase [Leptomonas seymouri]|eukprot:KPI89986.1 putative RNA triphosphatase [Leptomonas seymouri]
MSSPESGEAKACADTKTQEFTSAPQPTEAASNFSATASIAHAILARMKPFLSEQYIEVEARLCDLGAHPPPLTANSVSAPHLLNGSCRGIQVGVSAEDFHRMRDFLEAEEKLSLQHTKTEDVITRDGRYTYAIAEDGAETFVGCIKKKRLCNVEVRVPGSRYDIRLSVSTEEPRKKQDAPAVKPQGFVRQKSRWTATEGTYEYALTRVGGPADEKTTFEVEIEGVHADAQKGVTVAWLEELMSRLLKMARLEGNTGLPRNAVPLNQRKQRR